jgi:hypothetical protein
MVSEAGGWDLRAYFFRQAVLVTFSIQSGYLVAKGSRPGGLTGQPISRKSWRGFPHKFHKKEKKAFPLPGENNEYSSARKTSCRCVLGGDDYRCAGANGQHDLPVQQRVEP